jgi:hypothetical protein
MASSPLLRLVLVLLVMVTALAVGMFASSAHTGWLFLGVAFAGAPVAAMADGWARSRGRRSARVVRASRPSSVCSSTAGAASAW